MVIIIYGDNTTASRKEIDIQTGKAKTTRIDGKRATIDEYTRALQSDALFGGDEAVVIEQFTKIPVVSQKKVIEIIQHAPDSQKIILWIDGKLGKKIHASFPKAHVLEFKNPANYYQFLDSLRAGNAKQLHTLLEKLERDYTGEQIFYSVFKRARQLLLVQEGILASNEFVGMQAWQIDKLKKQARMWTPRKLKSFYKKLFILEKAQKTSTNPLAISEHLDMVILSDLQ